ncbi:hypothetical protein [Luedemannella flava]|uniref:hypothetical protein n=1 Tax=Luedemannella flava TaxID=349316 RepID=UPI0031D01427
MTRGVDHEKAVLRRLIDSRLADLEAGCQSGGCDHLAVKLAGQVAANLRRVVDETADGNAADRARVRGAVHLFHGLGHALGVTRPRTLPYELRKINNLVLSLGAADLRMPPAIAGCPLFEGDPSVRRRCPMFQRVAAA